MLGAHFSKFADAAVAADVLGLKEEVAERKEWIAAGNWARHSPPPGLSAAKAAPHGVAASVLEQFREQLYMQSEVASEAAASQLCAGGAERGRQALSSAASCRMPARRGTRDSSVEVTGLGEREAELGAMLAMLLRDLEAG